MLWNPYNLHAHSTFKLKTPPTTPPLLKPPGIHHHPFPEALPRNPILAPNSPLTQPPTPICPHYPSALRSLPHILPLTLPLNPPLPLPRPLHRPPGVQAGKNPTQTPPARLLIHLLLLAVPRLAPYGPDARLGGCCGAQAGDCPGSSKGVRGMGRARPLQRERRECEPPRTSRVPAPCWQVVKHQWDGLLDCPLPWVHSHQRVVGVKHPGHSLPLANTPHLANLPPQQPCMPHGSSNLGFGFLGVCALIERGG